MDFSIPNQEASEEELAFHPPERDGRYLEYDTNRAHWGLPQGQDAPSSSQQVEEDERRILFSPTPSMSSIPVPLRAGVAVAQGLSRGSDDGTFGSNGSSRVVTPQQNPDAASPIRHAVPEQIRVLTSQSPPHNQWYTPRAERPRGSRQRRDVLPNALPFPSLPSARARRMSRNELSAYEEHQGLQQIAPRSLITDALHNASERSGPSPRRRVYRPSRARTRNDRHRDRPVDPALVEEDHRAFSSIANWGYSAEETVRARNSLVSSRSRRDLADTGTSGAMRRYANRNGIRVNPDDLRRQYWDTDYGIPIPTLLDPGDIPPVVNGLTPVNPRNHSRAEQRQPGSGYGSGALVQSPAMTPSQFMAGQVARAVALAASTEEARSESSIADPDTSSDNDSQPVFNFVNPFASIDLGTSPPSSNGPRSGGETSSSSLSSLLSFDEEPTFQHAENRDRGYEPDTDSDTNTIIPPIQDEDAVRRQNKERYIQLCEEYGHHLDRHCITVYSQARLALSFDTECFSGLPNRNCFRDIGKYWLSKEVSGIREAVTITRDFLIKFNNLSILSRTAVGQSTIPELGELCQLLHTQQFRGERLLWNECIKIHTRESTGEILYARGITPDLDDPRSSRTAPRDVPESSIQRNTNSSRSPAPSMFSEPVSERQLRESSFEHIRTSSPLLDAPTPRPGSPIALLRSPGPTPGMETPPRASEDFFDTAIGHSHPRMTRPSLRSIHQLRGG